MKGSRAVCLALPRGVRHGKAGSFWSACHCILLVSLFQSEARLRLHSITPFKINSQISMLALEGNGIDRNLRMRTNQYF